MRIFVTGATGLLSSENSSMLVIKLSALHVLTMVPWH